MTEDRMQLLLQRVFDPVLGVERDADGNITKLNGPPRPYPRVETRTVQVTGVVLPWRRYARERELIRPERPRGGFDVIEWSPYPPEQGEVFVPMETLYALAEQDTWDSQFGQAFLLSFHEGLALEQAGLAAAETRGGYHRTDALLAFIREYEKDNG